MRIQKTKSAIPKVENHYLKFISGVMSSVAANFINNYVVAYIFGETFLPLIWNSLKSIWKLIL